MHIDTFIAKYKFAILKSLLETPLNKINETFNGFKITPRSSPGQTNNSQDTNGYFLLSILKTIVLENNSDSIQTLVKEISAIQSKSLKEFVFKYPHIFDWKILSKNPSIEWNPEEINKYSEFISFKEISFNTSVKFTPQLLESFSDSWDWIGISGNPAVFKGCGEYILNHIGRAHV
jgi:hypothetical protein